jgi:hypothetical protein
MSQQFIELTMRSKKQHIRLWFECLQICQSDDEYSDNLKKSKEFYKEWGDITNIKFDHWWKDKRYIFNDVYVREVNKVSNNPNTITLSIPLNEKLSTIVKDVKRLVDLKQTEKLIEMGKDPTNRKSKSLGIGKYSFTKSEIKGVFHYVNLEIYKIYLRLNKPPINRKFLIEIRKDFDSRKRSQLRKSILNIPTMDEFNELKTNVALDDNIRSIRRGVNGVKKTLTNVSKGLFP